MNGKKRIVNIGPRRSKRKGRMKREHRKEKSERLEKKEEAV